MSNVDEMFKLKFSPTLNKSAYEMFAELMKEKSRGKNLVFSPYSLQQMFDYIGSYTTNKEYLEQAAKHSETGLADEQLCNTKTTKDLQIKLPGIFEFTTTADFASEWESKFDERDSKLEKFTLEDGKIIKTLTMHKDFNEDETECPGKIESGYEIVCLPCQETAKVYFIKPVGIKPEALVYEIDNIIKKFDSCSGDKLTKLSFSMPKITELRDKLDIIELVKVLGFKKFFDGKSVLEKLEPFNPVILKNAVQETSIKLDEKGAKAFAITHFIACVGGMPMFKPLLNKIEIKMDSPYYIVITDGTKNTGVGRVVFVSYIANPQG